MLPALHTPVTWNTQDHVLATVVQETAHFRQSKGDSRARGCMQPRVWFSSDLTTGRRWEPTWSSKTASCGGTSRTGSRRALVSARCAPSSGACLGSVICVLCCIIPGLGRGYHQRMPLLHLSTMLAVWPPSRLPAVSGMYTETSGHALDRGASAKRRDMNAATSQEVFAGPYLDDPAERARFSAAFAGMTAGFLAFPLCLPGTAVWRGRQGRLHVLRVLARAAARSKAAMRVGLLCWRLPERRILMDLHSVPGLHMLRVVLGS